jgi:hypothetical protein
VNWTARHWKLAGLVVVVMAIGALICSVSERGERADDDQQPAGLPAYLTLWTADIGREIMGPFGAIRMPLMVALYGIAASAMIGLASGAAPAVQMVRRKIVNLLRGN